MPVRLRDIAPRLAKARDDWYAERVQQRRAAAALVDQRRRDHADRLGRQLQLEWLVAHRELQLVRAAATRSSRYIRRRQRLLDEARKEQARFLMENPS